MATITLYDANFPGTRGSRTRWMLEELGVPYRLEAVEASKGAHKRPPYAPDIHPHGLVPAAEIDGTLLIESAGICMQLSDMHPEMNLGAEVGSLERARWYQWITYAAATLDEPMVGWILHAMIFPEERRRPEPIERGKSVWAIAAPFLEKSLGDKTWILGDRFTTADVVLGYDVGVAARLGALEGYPRLGAYMGRLGARPAFQKAYSG